MNFVNFIKYIILKKECKKHFLELNFDMRVCDEKIAKIADSIYKSNKKHFLKFNGFKSQIGFFATKLYDIGGHTPWLINVAESFFENEKNPLFISKKKSTYICAPKNMQKLELVCDVFDVECSKKNYAESLIKAYNKVIQNCPRVVFLFMHPIDIFMTSLIYLLKKNTEIKFIYFDHASHYPNLSMTMVDMIIEAIPSAAQTLVDKRKITVPYRICELQSKKKNEVKYFSKEDIANKRAELNIKKTELLTVSGGSSYKYFDEIDSKSEHFEMIKRILERNTNLKHLAITTLNSKQESIINKIFEKSPEVRKRLLIQPMTPEYQILFQCADLFIDSFPVSSAMTQIDLMSMKIPSVVKINTNNPELSFHEYMPTNYSYMYKKVEDMEEGILNLLSNVDERQKVAEKNYDFWLNHYESEFVKKKYLEILKGLDKNVELINFLRVPYEIQLETRNWRNSEKVTEWFKIQYIDEDIHKKWLESLKKESPENIAFLIKYNKNYVGVTYFHSIDYDKQEADWGIYIFEENMRGLGIGSKVLEESIRYAFNDLKLDRIFLDVKKSNEIAKKIYINKGFKICYEKNCFLRMELLESKKI